MSKRYVLRVFDSASSKFSLLLKFKKFKLRAKYVLWKLRHHLNVKKEAVNELRELFWD